MAGALTGLLLREQNGMSVGFIAFMTAASLGFGLWSAAGRNRDADARHEAFRIALVNAGALWVACLAIVFSMALALPAAMGVSLVFGLFGSRALERLEASGIGVDILTKIAQWWLGKLPPK